MLKPVDDTRMYEKMAVSLANSGRYHVHIIGFPSSRVPSLPHITFHPSASFGRLNPVRFMMPIRFFVIAMKIRPAIAIINTHELLWACSWLKLFASCRLLYDVRENYYRNIRYLPTFPSWLRPVLAAYVRGKEKLLRPFVNGFLFAEAGYRHELTFVKKNIVVIENKAGHDTRVRVRSYPVRRKRFLFSGTLATSSGVFIAIELIMRLHQIDPDIALHIIGYCAQPGTLRKIRDRIKDLPYIRLSGGDHLVPHTEIAAAIAASDVGIVAYPPNLSAINTTPTKLFEYLAAQLPIVMLAHDPWIERCKPYNAAVTFRYPDIDAAAVLHNIDTQQFYQHAPGPEVFWDTEARKLVALCDEL